MVFPISLLPGAFAMSEFDNFISSSLEPPYRRHKPRVRIADPEKKAKRKMQRDSRRKNRSR